MPTLHAFETIKVAGVKWPLRVRHVSMARVATLPLDDPARALRFFHVHVGPRWDGPSTPRAFVRWSAYHPAQALAILSAVLAVQQPTVRERLMLRVFAFHRPGDGVWEVNSGGKGATVSELAALGLCAATPRTHPFATRWDTTGPIEESGDDPFVTCTNDRRGVGAFVHPSLFLQVAPRLRPVLAYHNLARPAKGAGLSCEEYHRMSAFEALAHRGLRDACARRKAE